MVLWTEKSWYSPIVQRIETVPLYMCTCVCWYILPPYTSEIFHFVYHVSYTKTNMDGEVKKISWDFCGLRYSYFTNISINLLEYYINQYVKSQSCTQVHINLYITLFNCLWGYAYRKMYVIECTTVTMCTCVCVCLYVGVFLFVYNFLRMSNLDFFRII